MLDTNYPATEEIIQRFLRYSTWVKPKEFKIVENNIRIFQADRSFNGKVAKALQQLT